jgi:hypothetical protein
MTFEPRKKLRIIVLVHEDLVPPDSLNGLSDKEKLEIKTEFDVVSTLKSIRSVFTINSTSSATR